MSLRTVLFATVLMSGLSACDVQPTKVGPGASTSQTVRDDAEREARARTPIKMPPSIAATKQFRCADNTLAFVEFYSDDRSASVKTDPKATAVRVEAPTAGQTMVAEGWSLKGGKADAKVVFSSPGHPKPQSCHV